eukprot:scaffold6306_cov135-Amphora_coffeaeformis.AAC.6
MQVEEEPVTGVSSPVHLGFIETVENEEQLRRIAHRSANFNDWDGGQVGGCPSFLNPAYVPDAPQCRECQGVMNFICQLYAPVDEYEDRAFHRSLYVFGCSKCQNNHATQNNIRVFRCQLPQDNPYFPTDPSNEQEDDCINWKQHLPESHGVHLCQVCGMRGKYKCPLQQIYFCGKDHQREYKKHVFDKIKNGEIPTELPSVFPLAELAVDAEITTTGDNDTKDACRDAMFENNDDDNDSDAELEQEDLNRMTGKKETVKQDNFTQTFMQRIKHQPDQALRYARWKVTDDINANDGQVLWIRQDYRPTNIPDCPYCGAPRRFEFQLMPQMLDHLNANHAPKKSTLENTTAKETYEQYKTALRQAEDLIREAPPEAIPPVLVENKERAAARMRDYLLQQRNQNKMEWGVVATPLRAREMEMLRLFIGKNLHGGNRVSTCHRKKEANAISITTSIKYTRKRIDHIPAPIRAFRLPSRSPNKPITPISSILSSSQFHCEHPRFDHKTAKKRSSWGPSSVASLYNSILPLITSFLLHGIRNDPDANTNIHSSFSLSYGSSFLTHGFHCWRLDLPTSSH